MKHLFVLCAAAMSFACCGNKPQAQSEAVPAQPKFSTFSDHVLSVARQDSISLLEAAKWVHSIGIDGVDARTSLSDEQMADLDAAGLQHACAILDVVWTKDPVPPLQNEAIAFCKKYNFDRLMYCPPLLPEGATPEQKDSLMADTKAFADKAIAAGIDLLFEDYDNPRALTFNMAALDKVFEAIPNANHAYDSGNFFFAGDDPMQTFEHFHDRISHVHLKDRVAVGDKASPAAGTGAVPCRQLVDRLMEEGYQGWITIEGYGAKDMKEQLKVSVDNMVK